VSNGIPSTVISSLIVLTISSSYVPYAPHKYSSVKTKDSPILQLLKAIPRSFRNALVIFNILGISFSLFLAMEIPTILGFFSCKETNLPQTNPDRVIPVPQAQKI